MARKQRVTAVDVGATKICCIIADASARGDLEIIGMGVSPNGGMRRGVVVDVDEVTQAIRSAVGEAEGQAGVSVSRCFVNLSGDFLGGDSSRGSVAIGANNRVINEHDVQRVIENARMVGVPDGRRMLHVIPKGFTVNEVSGIKNPVGLSAMQLMVDAHIITGSVSPLQNLQNCMEMAELEPEENSGLVVSGVATSLGVLQDEEKDLGVALVDIGGGTTDLAVFKEGHLRHTDVLCVGGTLVTYDVATALRVPLQEAERLVIQEGLSFKQEMAARRAAGEEVEAADMEREIEVTSLSSVQPQPVKVSELSEIIDLRLMDVFEWLRVSFDRLGKMGTRPASIVLTGGVAEMKGVAWAAEQALGYPVRIARPESVRGLPSHLRNPAYSASVGLLIYGLGVLKGKTPVARSSSVNKALQGFITWLKEYVF
ncbi:MAG: cell division protein FtsA [Armatimonadetes bacterium]|nr:cell division protein FtsA [Armatimonadota bacterium]